jgi:hypothetical protein
MLFSAPHLSEPCTRTKGLAQIFWLKYSENAGHVAVVAKVRKPDKASPKHRRWLSAPFSDSVTFKFDVRIRLHAQYRVQGVT